MAAHLSNTHAIVEDRAPSASPHQLPKTLPLKHNRDSLIAKLAAKDNIPFKTIATSTEIREIITHYTSEAVPKSPNTIKRIVLDTAEHVRGLLRAEIRRSQLRKYPISLTFDEATASNSPHRYLSLTVRMPGENASDWPSFTNINLGLVRISGNATAENISAEIDERLTNFGIRVSDCFAATTDGASTMKSAVQSKLRLRSQLCFVHGLHLVLNKVLRLPSGETVAGLDSLMEDESEDDDGNETPVETDSDEEDSNDADPEEDPSGVLQDLTAMRMLVIKVRRTLRGIIMHSIGILLLKYENASSASFSPQSSLTISNSRCLTDISSYLTDIKRSGPKRDRLRELTAQENFNGKPLGVKLDTKSRWYSTISMLERALLIMPALNTLLRKCWMSCSLSRRQ